MNKVVKDLVLNEMKKIDCSNNTETKIKLMFALLKSIENSLEGFDSSQVDDVVDWLNNIIDKCERIKKVC